MNRTIKIRITELNPHVTCVLCRGYFINATAITECLHSFCRTCITHYLETSKHCPVCDVMVHKTRPLDCIRSDKTLQDLVYKLIPGLYKNEMKRRREYYANVDHSGISQPPSEDRGDEFHDRIIYTEDERFSLSLELCADFSGIPFKTSINVHSHNGPENMKKKDVRYLWCPAVFSVGNIKKFIRMKFDLKCKYEIDIFHTSEPLPNYYSLMDIAYIYTWTRRTPLRLYYTVFERKILPNVPAPISNNQSNEIANHIEEKMEQSKPSCKDMPKRALEKARSKKRTFSTGPDDISPDIDVEKAKAGNWERNKTAMARKRVKRMVVEDDSILEGMSESEGQLAKLTLNSASDGRKLCVTERTAPKEKPIVDDIVNQKNSKSFKAKIVEHIHGQCANVERNGSNGATQDSDSDGKASSHPSPGCESVKLSLFQPLNCTYDEHSESRANTESLYDFTDVEAQLVKQKKSHEKQSSTRQGKKKIANDSNTESSMPARKLRANGTNLVISKYLPGLSLPTQTKTRRKVTKNNDANVVGINAQMKLKKSDVTCKMEKNVPKDSNSVKRKYVRKVTLEKAKNNSKRNDKEIKSLMMKTNSNSAQGSSWEVDNKSVDGNLNTDCTANKSKELHSDCHLKESMCTDNKIVNVKDYSKQQSVNDTIQSKSSEQDRMQSNSLQQPSTPLYGQIPKLDESNQGLPHSPKTNLVDVTNKKTAEDDVKICDLNGTKTNDSVCVNGGVTANEINLMENVDYVDSSSYGNSLQPVVSVQQNQVVHGLCYLDTHNSHLEIVRNNLNVFPSNSLSTISLDKCSPSPMNVNASRLTNGSAHAHNDTNCDQPLDLTRSNGHREGYAKGKIFKTKLLKKSLPKQEIVHSHREKMTVPSSNGLKPSSH